MILETKNKLRDRIWRLLEDNNFIRGKKPAFGRIPNFKGADGAANRLKSTSEWKKSEIIFCSPDSTQREVRYNALDQEKVLIMASPKLKRGYILIDPLAASGHEDIASTIKGAFRYGRVIHKFPLVDLVVEGSVAVDLAGNRLGKGGGYGDREITHLSKVGSINGDTTLVTTVHDLQIVEMVPHELHDQKINMIVTPERVIRTQIINTV